MAQEAQTRIGEGYILKDKGVMAKAPDFGVVSDLPLVSVLIGTRDRDQSLLRCLDSVLGGDYPKLEVLVLDDCSQRFSVCGIITKEISDHRVKCFRSERQLGVAGGRNFLVKRARGEILIVIDDDAVFADKNTIASTVTHFLRAPDVSVLAFKIVNYEGEDQDLRIPFSRHSRKRWPKLHEETRLVSYYLGGAYALRREVIAQCGLYQKDLLFGEEELDLSYRVIQAGFKIMYTPFIVAHHYPEASVVGKDPGKHTVTELELRIRNRIWVAYKYLPFPYLPVHLLIYLSHYGALAVKGLQMGAFIRGIWAGIEGLRRLTRTPLDEQAITYLKKNWGRLWY